MDLTFLKIDRAGDEDAKVCKEDPTDASCGTVCDKPGQMRCPGKQGFCIDAKSEEELQENCPINDIKIGLSKEKRSFSRQNPSYKIEEFTDSHFIAYSKEADARPLTEFKIDFQACMNKTETGWPGVYGDAETGDRSWRNYHPRELLIQWSKYENDDETQTLATLASPLFGCHVDEYT